MIKQQNTASFHGLSLQQIELIKKILRPWESQIRRVALFGSRATGEYKYNSDIDLVLYGDLEQKDIDRLWTLFNDSNLPYKVDIQAYHLINYPPFKEHIDQVAQDLY